MPYPYRDEDDADTAYDQYGPVQKGKPAAPLANALPAFLKRLEIRAKLTPLCESPIEIDLGAALIDLAGDSFIIEPQYELGRYRYDFVIRLPDGSPYCVVECDGEEFHSTPEQLANDEAKNKFAIASGVNIARSTGKNIYYSPDDEARRILEWLKERLR